MMDTMSCSKIDCNSSVAPMLDCVSVDQSRFVRPVYVHYVSYQCYFIRVNLWVIVVRVALYRLDSGNCKLSFFLCLLSLGRSAAFVFFEDKGKSFSD